MALGAYSPQSPLALHYSDAASSIYPDRPIRPLPKRRIRSRLSSEKADSILHSSPSAPPVKLFQIPQFGLANSQALPALHSSALQIQAKARSDVEQSDSYHFTGNDVGSDREPVDTTRGTPKEQRLRPSSVIPHLRTGNAVLRSERTEMGRHNELPMSQSIASSADSVDGYDSFENTNNKKKRKIPANGNNHSSLSAEMASMGLSSTRELDVSHGDQDGGVSHYYGTGSSAVPTKSSSGLSSGGKSRFGRNGARRRSTRSPLGVSFNGSNYPRRVDGGTGDGMHKEAAIPPDQGITSAAIASAAALPTPATVSTENLSRHPSSSKKSTSGRTQFTFTCESDAAKSMMWPGYGGPSANSAYPGMVNGIDGAYDGPGAQPNDMISGMSQHPSQAAPNLGGTDPQRSQQPKKPRRPLSKQYALAARDRRIQQNYSNYHHPPKEEDVWICDYCEYEAIFGRPPEALIRQYEIKDRRERRRIAEKRRLLEKAKMKGRKGKKGNKNVKNANTAAQAQQANQKQTYDQQPVDDYAGDQQGLQSDDCIVDEDDDDPMPTPTLPPQTPSRIPQPVTKNPTHSIRPPSGTGGVRANSGNGLAL